MATIFADHIFKRIFLNENWNVTGVCSQEPNWQYVRLVLVMVWRLTAYGYCGFSNRVHSIDNSAVVDSMASTLGWCHMSVIASQNASNPVVYSTAYSDQQKSIIKAQYYWLVWRGIHRSKITVMGIAFPYYDNIFVAVRPVSCCCSLTSYAVLRGWVIWFPQSPLRAPS